MVNKKYATKEDAIKAQKEKRKKYNETYNRKVKEKKMREMEEFQAVVGMYKEGELYDSKGNKVTYEFVQNILSKTQ